jgi:glucose 1-dehydrogenase
VKTVIVTGGAGAGIGGGIVTAAAEAGWNVVILDKDRAGGEALEARLASEGRCVAFLCADLVEDDCPQKAVDYALRRFGRLDALVNNAGIGLVKDIAEVSDEEYRRIFQVNFDAVYRLCRAAVPAMPDTGGAIVNIGSVHALATIAGYTVYAATKGAIEAFTRALAVDCGPRAIRVNCIHPGLVPSPQNRELIERFAGDADAWLESYTRRKQLLPWLPSARQIGELVMFFLSDAAAMITGQAIAADAGSSIMLYER